MSNNNEFDSMSPTVRAVYSALGGKAPTQAAVQEAPVETTVNEQVDESVTDDVIVVDIFEENGEIESEYFGRSCACIGGSGVNHGRESISKNY